MAIITLTSDYGTLDPYLAVVKATLLSENKEINIVDISHDVEPGNIIQAAFVLNNSYSAFPKGSVHLVSVSELTESNRFLAIELEGHFFLGSDNGLLSLLQMEKKFSKQVEIDLRLEPSLFPSRDLLSKAAAHLSRGGSIDMLGRPASKIKESIDLKASVDNEKSSITGSVVYIDNYGNLITNISKKLFVEHHKERNFQIKLARNREITKIQESYYPSQASSVLAIFNSLGLLEIAVFGSRGRRLNSAHALLGMNERDPIIISFS